MKAKILDINGKSKGEISLPKCFSAKIREDIVAKFLETKKNQQPYSPSSVAGKQYSASGKLIHRRHVWKSQYGRGMSRVPRKIMIKRGSQFHWEGAVSPNTKGGRRAHPPKVSSKKKKINKKEIRIAFNSAISATADRKFVEKKYKRVNEKKISNLPIIVESKITSLKIKNIISSLKKILEKHLFEIAIKKKKVRAGKGKLRGRKYKKNAGLLFVVGNKEKLKTNAFDVSNIKNLGVKDLANGGLGRLTIYTEQAITEIGNLCARKSKDSFGKDRRERK